MTTTTKQEALREGIAEVLDDVESRYTGQMGIYGAKRDETVEFILQYLHDNDVVIKVKKELPLNHWDSKWVTHPHFCVGHDAVSEAQDDMIEAGYTATEPLIGGE